MKVINNLFLLSPEGQIPGYGSMQEGMFFQDFLIFLLAYLNQGENNVSINPNFARNLSINIGNNSSIVEKLQAQGQVQQNLSEENIKSLTPNHLTEIQPSDAVLDTSEVTNLKNLSPSVKDFTLNEKGQALEEDFSKLSFYTAFALILLESVLSYDSNKLNADQENRGFQMNNFPVKEGFLNSLNFNSHYFQDKFKEVLTSIERISTQFNTENFENFFKTFSSLNGLSSEAQGFLKTYFETLRDEMKEGFSLKRNFNLTDLTNIKESFSQLSDSVKREVRGLIQQATEEVKEIVPLEKGMSRNSPEVSLPRVWFSEEGKPLLLKVKTLSVKDDLSSNSKPQVLVHNPADFYLRGKEFSNLAESFSQSDKVLPLRVAAEDIHHFVKELTIEIVPTGERRATVQLEPPELGKMELEVKVQNGEVEVHARVEKPETLSHLQQDLSQIKTQLEDLGLRLKDLQISLGLSPEGKNFSHGEEKGSQQKNTKFRDGVNVQVEGLEEKRPIYHQGRLYRIV